MSGDDITIFITLTRYCQTSQVFHYENVKYNYPFSYLQKCTNIKWIISFY